MGVLGFQSLKQDAVDVSPMRTPNGLDSAFLMSLVRLPVFRFVRLFGLIIQPLLFITHSSYGLSDPR